MASSTKSEAPKTLNVLLDRNERIRHWAAVINTTLARELPNLDDRAQVVALISLRLTQRVNAGG